MKKKLIAGNWKMNGSLAANETLVKGLLTGLGTPACHVALCVPSVYLAQVQTLVAGSTIDIGVQDLSPHEVGAFTGEISGAMLKAMDEPSRNVACRAEQTAWCAANTTEQKNAAELKSRELNEKWATISSP